jgi:hypothetical protein
VSTSDEPDAAAARVSGLRLTYALFGGIMAWMAHLIAMAGLNGWVCRTGQLWPRHAVTAATLAATLHVLWVSWQVSRDPTPDPGVRAAQFLGFAAIVINVFNAALIVAEWVPVLVIHPCSTG